jgi:predicted transcriptional regulator
MDNDNSFDLFNNLSNEKRIKILNYLLNKKSNLSKISKEINQSNQATLSHLNKLVNSGLIQKNLAGNYSVSEYGKSILIKNQYVEFITKHKNFFKEHSFGDIPNFLLNCIGMLSKAEFVDGAVANFERWNKMIENANEFFYGIFTQTPHQTDVSLATKSAKGLKIKLIFGKNGLMSDYSALAKKLHFDKTSQTTIERRISELVFVNIMITENYACVMFPDRKNQTDVGRTFLGTDNDFHQWCIEFFNHKWHDSVPFSRFRKFELN